MRHGSASRTQLAEGNGLINNPNNDDSSFNGAYYVPGAVLNTFMHTNSSNAYEKVKYYSYAHFADEETKMKYYSYVHFADEAQRGHTSNYAVWEVLRCESGGKETACFFTGHSQSGRDRGQLGEACLSSLLALLLLSRLTN